MSVEPFRAMRVSQLVAGLKSMAQEAQQLVAEAAPAEPASAVRPVHTKARQSPYLNGPARTPVSDTEVPWTNDDDYSPVDYTAPSVAKQPVWADPPIPDEIRFNFCDRMSHEGFYRLTGMGIPMNPRGRTGMTGRGSLGKWGPNHAADPIVARWKRDANGNAIGFEFVAIKRKDNGEWAIPGGMVDAGEQVSLTLKREFGEEALNTLELSPESKADAMAKVERLFDNGLEVYKGYVDDPRNTDNAWMETVAMLFFDHDGTLTTNFTLQAGDDAGGVRWATYEIGMPLYASHTDFIARAYELVKSTYPPEPKQEPVPPCWCRRENGFTSGWCGVAGGGVPACDH
jgi:ADP-ribose pyrophosphatase